MYILRPLHARVVPAPEALGLHLGEDSLGVGPVHLLLLLDLVPGHLLLLLLRLLPDQLLLLVVIHPLAVVEAATVGFDLAAHQY